MTDARHDDKEPTPEQKRVQALKTRCLNIALTIAELFDVYEKFSILNKPKSTSSSKLRWSPGSQKQTSLISLAESSVLVFFDRLS